MWAMEERSEVEQSSQTKAVAEMRSVNFPDA